MPTYYARASGNVNANNVWATTPGGTAGAQTFVAGDILVANSFTVTINVNTDLGTGTVTNDNRDGATQGGSFTLNNGIALTANVVAGGAASSSVVNYSGTGTGTSITGNVTGGSGTSANGVTHSGTGALTITGAITGGSNTNAVGVNFTGTGTLTVVGNCNASSGTNSHGITVVNAGTCTVTGNCTGGTSGFGVAAGTGTTTITGTCTGGTGVGSPGAGSSSSGTLNIVGTAVGAAGVGATNVSTGTMTVTRAKGGPLSTSNVGVNGGSSSVTRVEEIEYGDLGASPTSGAIRLTTASTNVALFYVPSAAKKTLVDANASGLMPAASNVRSGTVYNGGNSTGTCAVPAASSVAFGVPVDATTGTAALTPAAVWDYLTASASTANSMGERLRNAATVASTGQALADALTP